MANCIARFPNKKSIFPIIPNQWYVSIIQLKILWFPNEFLLYFLLNMSKRRAGGGRKRQMNLEKNHTGEIQNTKKCSAASENSTREFKTLCFYLVASTAQLLVTCLSVEHERSQCHHKTSIYWPKLINYNLVQSQGRISSAITSDATMAGGSGWK